MLNQVRKLPEMRITGSLTGVSGLGAMTADMLGASISLCLAMVAVSFLFLILLTLTTIRPHWVVYIAGETSGLLARLSHRAAPPHAT